MVLATLNPYVVSISASTKITPLMFRLLPVGSKDNPVCLSFIHSSVTFQQGSSLCQNSEGKSKKQQNIEELGG